MSGRLDFMRGSAAATYQQAARAYSGNEIVSSALDLISKSAGEPQIIGRRWRRGRTQIRAEMRRLNAFGIKNRVGARMADAALVRNGFWEEVDGHPLVKLLNQPNPYRSRSQFWGEVCLDRYLAGNAYVLKARYTDGPLEGAVAELYRLRPDRVNPVPGDMEAGEPFIKRYDYTVDARTIRPIAAKDIIHFRANDPLDPYRGLSPVAAILERVDIDRYMRNFLGTFYARGGASVGAVLNVKGKMDQALKDDIRTRFRRIFGGGQYDILVSNADELTYTPLGLDRGLRDALPKEIDAVTEARIAMKLGIPGSILGLLIGYESSSYANKRQDWQVFWDITMAPLLSDFDDVLNLSLMDEFGGIDEVAFDLSDIRALQEDSEALKESARKDWMAGLVGFHESRTAIGYPPDPDMDEIFALSRASSYIPTGRIAEEQQGDGVVSVGDGQDVQRTALNGAQIASLLTVIEEVSTNQLSAETAKAILKVSFPSLDSDEIDELVDSAAAFDPNEDNAEQNTVLARAEALLRSHNGRPRLEDDQSARAIYNEAVELRSRYPHLTWGQISGRVAVSERTLREYRRRFAQFEDDAD